MDNDIDKILSKIRKLHAKAESAAQIGNEAEALAFAEKVTELLNKCKLEMSVLSQDVIDENDPLDTIYVSPGGRRKRTRQGWTETLANAVARAYYCRIMVIPGSNTIVMVGRKSDCAVAAYVFNKLVNFVESESRREERKARYKAWVEAGRPSSGEAPAAAGFRAAYIAGFLSRVCKRLDSLRDTAQSSSEGMALIIRKSDEEVTEYLKKQARGTARAVTHRVSSNRDGYFAGLAAGERASITGDGLRSGGDSSKDALQSCSDA